MSTDNTKREHPSTYIVQDRANQQEKQRLQLQDQMLTTMMGGVLPEQPDPTIFHDVLDVGCGCGVWLIETAKTYPTIKRLVGIDISKPMIEHARAEAEAQGVADRVEFQVMDALQLLAFPDDSFDLVNQRLGISYLRTWDWPNILQKYQRVVRPQGIIRISECGTVQGNRPIIMQMSEITLITFHRAGHFREQDPNALIKMLPPLFEQQGFQNIQTKFYKPRYPAGTLAGDLFADDMKHLFRTFVPFFRKWMRLPANYEELYQQMVAEMQEPGFEGSWDFMTIWGNPPVSKVRRQGRYQ